MNVIDYIETNDIKSPYKFLNKMAKMEYRTTFI